MAAKLKKGFFVSACLFFLFSVTGSAQCKVLAKKLCFPALNPFIQNGQLNSAKLSPGENAELQITFYSGQNYRLLICSEGVLGDVNFKVFDSEKKELFSSKKADYDENKDNKASTKYWDFNVSSTQQLIIIVEIPPSDAPNKLIPDGCVSVIVGFQAAKKK